MRSLVATVLALAVLALGSGAQVHAHEGHQHKAMGTVTVAAADHVMLKDKDGKDVMVKVTKDTKVKAKPAVKVEDIKVGSRIVITAVEGKDQSMTAKSIEVGAAAAATNLKERRRSHHLDYVEKSDSAEGGGGVRLPCAESCPRCTNIGPPGSANALMSFRFTGVNEYS